MATAAMATLAVLSVQPAAAAVAYLVTVNTPANVGTNGSIEFQFNPGNSSSQPATAAILQFTADGTLNGPPAIAGNVSGALPGTVTLVNSTGFNDYFQGYTYGQTFSFVLVLSGPAIDSPNGTATAGSTFCLSLWSDPNGMTPILVQDAAGCNGSVNVNLNGSTTAFPGVGAAIVTFTPVAAPGGGNYRIGYAANLNIGDSVVNLSNDGVNGGVFGAGTTGNICVNTYVFDPQEEEIGCCACLVTPNGLNSLSAKSDLISNNLTPAVPTSIVIKLVASTPGTDKTGAFTVCNPATVAATSTVAPTNGLLAWGSTLEPNSTPGTYNAVPVPFLIGSLSNGSIAVPPATGSELAGMRSLCNFIQANGTGFGICKSCRLGALGGSKK
jgi:hypothetical protein